PDFWGLLNPEWSLCTKGRRQSPIDIKPQSLLYDPILRPIHIDNHKIQGILENNGHSVVFRMVDNELSNDGPKVSHHNSSIRRSKIMQISGGPLSYSYTFDSIQLHYGRTDSSGSEHTLDGISFPAELQIIGYNSDLYRNTSEASRKTNGLAAIALLIQISDESNKELKILTDNAHKIKYTGQSVSIDSFSISELVPDLNYYLTYEGSMTIPQCSETVTWIILNKPISITRAQGFQCPTFRKNMHYRGIGFTNVYKWKS
ncbi:putative carbonic anhydrase-like protein 2, partial [Dinothrombium tinctorium]